MTDGVAHVTIRILEKEYQVACPAEEKPSLVASAELLNSKMREIRDSGKVVGLDRVAVMAALNLANELLKAQEQDAELKNLVGVRLRSMREHLKDKFADLVKRVSEKNDLSEDDEKALKSAVEDWKKNGSY